MAGPLNLRNGQIAEVAVSDPNGFACAALGMRITVGERRAVQAKVPRDCVANGRTEATAQGTARWGSSGPARGRGPIRRGGRSVAPPAAAAVT